MNDRSLAPWLSPLLLALGVSLYLTIGLYDLRLPGLEHDEAFDASIAAAFLRGDPIDKPTIGLLGHDWPLMQESHVGPTAIYLLTASFKLFGASLITLRATFLALGVVTLLLLWRLGRRWFGEPTAAVAVLLCATSPAFLWWSRSGGKWHLHLLAIAIAAVLSLDSWWRFRRPRHLIAAAGLIGLGITSKILFLWLLPPLAIAALLGPGLRALRVRVREAPPWVFPAAAAAFLLGLAPMLVHLQASGDLVHKLLHNWRRTELFGHDNFAFFANLRFQAVEFSRVFSGSTLYLGEPSPLLPLGAAALWGALLFTSWRVFALHVSARSARLLTLLLVMLVLPLSTVSFTHIGGMYLFVIVPFGWLLVTSALTDIHSVARRYVSPTMTVAAAMLFAALLLTANLRANQRVLELFATTGGRGHWSDAILRLADILSKKHPGAPVVAMDWGFKRNLEFLTAGAVQPVEGFEYASTPSPTFASTCAKLLENPRHLYLFHTPRHSAFPQARVIFEEVVVQSGRRLQLEEDLRERDGEPNTFVFSVVGSK